MQPSDSDSVFISIIRIYTRTSTAFTMGGLSALSGEPFPVGEAASLLLNKTIKL